MTFHLLFNFSYTFPKRQIPLTKHSVFKHSGIFRIRLGARLELKFWMISFWMISFWMIRARLELGPRPLEIFSWAEVPRYLGTSAQENISNGLGPSSSRALIIQKLIIQKLIIQNLSSSRAPSRILKIPECLKTLCFVRGICLFGKVYEKLKSR